MARNLWYPHFFEINLIINPSEILLKSKLISDLKMNGQISENSDDAILRRHGKLTLNLVILSLIQNSNSKFS